MTIELHWVVMEKQQLIIYKGYKMIVKKIIIQKKNLVNSISFLWLFLIPVVSHSMLQKNNRFIEAGTSNAILIETFGEIQTDTYEITQSGVYLLSQDFLFAPLTSGPAIHIKTNNVKLDLNKRIVAQVTSTPDVVGILVDSGLSGIEIKNGNIVNIMGTGIQIQDGVSILNMHDISFKDCTICAVDLAGTGSGDFVETGTGGTIHSGILKNIYMSMCATDDAATSPFDLKRIDNFMMDNIVINKCGNIDSPIKLARFLQATECQLIGLKLVDNIGSSLYGFDLETCEDLIFAGCRIVNNDAYAAEEDFIGIRLSENSKSNIFKSCLILNNISKNGNLIGLSLEDNSEANFFHRFKVIENEGDSVIGCKIAGTGLPSNSFNNMFEKNYILRNKALVGDITGYLISNADGGVFKNCIVGYNSAEFGVATGILFEFGTGGDNWAIRKCEIFKNIGNTSANSFGIDLQTGSDNFFVQNVVFENGTLSANQMNGVPAGSITTVNPTNLNTATAPWTNIVITP